MYGACVPEAMPTLSAAICDELKKLTSAPAADELARAKASRDERLSLTAFFANPPSPRM